MTHSAESDAPVCDGDGGSVFTYEGPQFGAHIEEEPCRKCGGWHESPGERESRLRRENRRRPIRDLIRRFRRTCVIPPERSDP